MSSMRIAIQQGLLALGAIIISLVVATQWAATMLRHQATLGPPWLDLLRLKLYPAWKLLPWWLAFDAQAPVVFARAGAVAALGGGAAGLVAVGGAAWRAGRKPQAKAGLHDGRGVVLGLYQGRRIIEIWGDLDVAGIQPKHVLALRDRFADRPAAATNILRFLSTLLIWSAPRGWRSDNPCREVRKLKGGEGYAPWPWRDRSPRPEASDTRADRS